MTLGEVLPALQDNALDGAVFGDDGLESSMQFVRVCQNM